MQQRTNSDSIKLIEPGFLGSCWYGKYHYLEPWVGCEHNCSYCYSRSRNAVNNTLQALNASFEKITQLLPEDALLAKIAEEIKANKVKILKLCRYTDFFTPTSVNSGLSYRILKLLAESEVERIIITTKGVASDEIIDLIKQYKHKFSCNTVVKPECESILDPNTLPNITRLQNIQKIVNAGIFFTLHMDPLSYSLNMSEQEWSNFLDEVKSYGVTRVMFSYLVLDKGLISYLKQHLPESSLQTLLGYFDFSHNYDYNYIDEEIFFIKPELRKQHAEMLSKLLQKKGFNYVICGLKSTKGGLGLDKKLCHVCDGSFYA